LIIAPELLTSDAAKARVDEARAAGVDAVEVTAGVYEALSERDGPSGLGAVVGLADGALADVAVTDDTIVVALDEISNPGNLGTIVRTADGAGASAVVVVGDAADPNDPMAVKASMGTIFAVPVVRSASLDELFGWASERGLQIVTTSARASASYRDAAYRLPALLVLGSEGDGLSAGALQRGDLQVRIEMRGVATSLNVAVAAGVLLFELSRASSS
jgi:TrmH family RNA methyltransferase